MEVAASTMGKEAGQADLIEDAEAGEGLDHQSDGKTEHGGATVEAFGTAELLLVDLADAGGLNSLAIGLEARGGHG